MTCAVSNNKEIFVLTDGYTTCGLGITEALVRADSENIEVIRIQVGLERPCVHRFYRDWIIAAIPAALCDAFRYKYRTDNDGPFPSLSDDNRLLLRKELYKVPRMTHKNYLQILDVYLLQLKLFLILSEMHI